MPFSAMSSHARFLTLIDEAEKEVLGADVVVAETQRRVASEFELSLGAGGEGWPVVSGEGPFAEGLLKAPSHLIKVDPNRRQRGRWVNVMSPRRPTIPEARRRNGEQGSRRLPRLRHILLGMLREGEGIACRVLAAASVTADDVES